MDQPIRTGQNDLPPDQPGQKPETPPDPDHPDLDSDVNEIELPGDDAPAPELDPPRERLNASVKTVATVPDTKSPKQP